MNTRLDKMEKEIREALGIDNKADCVDCAKAYILLGKAVAKLVCAKEYLGSMKHAPALRLLKETTADVDKAIKHIQGNTRNPKNMSYRPLAGIVR